MKFVCPLSLNTSQHHSFASLYRYQQTKKYTHTLIYRFLRIRLDYSLSISLFLNKQYSKTMSFGLGRPAATNTADWALDDPSTLWMAASEGHLTVLQDCLRSLQKTPDCADENGYTLLQAAASYGQVAVMEWLLQQPQVQVDAADHDGDTALHHATTVPAAQCLLQRSAALLFQRNRAQQTALEAKQMELQEILDDPDHEDDDEDLVQLKAVVEFLQSASHVAQ